MRRTQVHYLALYVPLSNELGAAPKVPTVASKQLQKDKTLHFASTQTEMGSVVLSELRQDKDTHDW